MLKTIYDIEPDVWEMAGPLSIMRRADAEKDWVTIKGNGVCNREIEISVQVADIAKIRLQEWLDYDMADYAAFSVCALSGGECVPGSSNTEDCPFSVVKDEITGRSCCCYTVLAGDTCVLEFLDDQAKYLDGEGPALRKVPKFRRWIRAMMNFYKAVRVADMKGGAE